MRIALVILLLMVSACGRVEDETAEPVDHSAHQMEMEPASAAHDLSIYQVRSSWNTQNGQAVNLSSLAGHVVVAAMTYTSCEVSCPRIVASMKTIQKGADDDVRFVLFSMDPDRDTPGNMKAYAERMNMDESVWTLLTAKPDDILELSALLGVRYRKMPDGEFAHSNILTVLSKTGVILYQQNGLGPDLTEDTLQFVIAL